MQLTSPLTTPEAATLRAERPQDEPFLRELYAAIRAAELEATGWTEEQRAPFLRMQFDAQFKHYHENYPGAVFQIIEADGECAGRLYLHRREAEIRIMDIALLPEFCGRGIGTWLLKEVLAEGERSGRVVTIHVEAFNPALRLYQRLGFTQVSVNGPYYLMRWSPQSAGCSDSVQKC